MKEVTTDIDDITGRAINKISKQLIIQEEEEKKTSGKNGKGAQKTQKCNKNVYENKMKKSVTNIINRLNYNAILLHQQQTHTFNGLPPKFFN